MEVYLTCRSLTYAQSVSRALGAVSIRNMIVRTPQNMSREGCGYAVRVGNSSLDAALEALDARYLPPRRIYRARPGGGFEEVVR